MSAYHPELLAPYQRLDQGTSIQAECIFFLATITFQV